MMIEARQSRLWTALPCVVQAFPAASGIGNWLLDAQPIMTGRALGTNGQFTEIQLPLLINVPVYFGGGGGVTLTFPIKPGDECLVVFASRCIDAWWQLGAGPTSAPGRTPPDRRMHNLSDGFAWVGFRSLPREPYVVNPDAALLISDDQSTVIGLNPISKVVTLTAPGGINLNGATIDQNGNLTSPGTIVGADVRNSAGTSLTTHLHPGVQTGGSDTLEPVVGS